MVENQAGRYRTFVKFEHNAMGAAIALVDRYPAVPGLLLGSGPVPATVSSLDDLVVETAL